MEDKQGIIERKPKSTEDRVVVLEIRMNELESENTLIMRALARLTEEKAEALSGEDTGLKIDNPQN